MGGGGEWFLHWLPSPPGYLPYLQGASACMPDGGCSDSAVGGGRGGGACGPREVGIVQLCPCTMWGTADASAARSVSSSGWSSSSETAPPFKDRHKQFLRPLWLVSKASRHPILAAETEDVINISQEPRVNLGLFLYFPVSKFFSVYEPSIFATLLFLFVPQLILSSHSYCVFSRVLQMFSN